MSDNSKDINHQSYDDTNSNLSQSSGDQNNLGNKDDSSSNSSAKNGSINVKNTQTETDERKKLAENESMDWMNDDVTVEEGHYMMEFRAVIGGEYHLPDKGSLVMYLQSQQCNLPMQYNPKIKAYQFMLPLPLNRTLQVYKFGVQLHDEQIEIIWEQIPYCSYVPVWNRRQNVDVESGQRKKHFVLFDVIVFEKKTEKEYMELLQKNMFKIIPCLDANSSSKRSSENIDTFLHFHTQWAKSYALKKEFVTQNGQPIRHIKCNDSQISMHDFLKHKAGKNSAVDAFECLCLFLSLRNQIGVLNTALKPHLCHGMSLENLDDSEFTVFLKLFDELKACFSISKTDTRRNFKNHFKEITRQLDEVAHYIFVVPLLKLAMIDVNEDSFKDPPSKFVYESFRAKIRKLEKQQNELLELNENIHRLSKRFPWIENLFVQTLNLRSVAKLLNLKPNHTVCLKELIDKIVYFWQQLTNYSSNETLDETTFKTLYNCLIKKLKKKICAVEHQKNEKNEDIELNANMVAGCSKIPSQIKQYFRRNKQSCNLSFLSFTMNLFDGVIECAQTITCNDDLKVSSEVKKLQDNVLTTVEVLVKEAGYSFTTKKFDIMCWNCLSDIEWSNQTFLEKWRFTLHNVITDEVQKVFISRQKDLFKYYCDVLEKQEPTKRVNEWFTEVVINNFIDFMNSQTRRDYIQKGWEMIKKAFSPGSGFQEKVETLCVKILQQQWERCPQYQTKKPRDFLTFVQNWNVLFLQTLLELKMTEQLPFELRRKIDVIKQSLRGVMDDLFSGQIVVEGVQLLQEIKLNFCDCLNMIQKKPTSSSVDKPSLAGETFRQLLALRVEEMDKFFDARNALNDMLLFFQAVTKGKLWLKCEALQEVLGRNIDSLPLNSLVKFRQFKHEAEGPIPAPRIICFNVPAEDIALVRELHSKKILPLRSEVVKEQMVSLVVRAQEFGLEEMTFSEALKNLWEPLQNKIAEVVKKIDDETMLLKNVDELFGIIGRQVLYNPNILNEELKNLYEVASDVRLVEGRRLRHFNLLNNYYSLKQSLIGAKLLKKMKDMLELAGDFDDLNKLLAVGQDDEDLTLSAMDAQIQKTNKDFKILSKEAHHLETLECFVQAEELVTWLKRNIADSKEVKVMIDLAMISAGEVPMEVDRVSCFNSAVMGFSPLLFNLFPDNGLKDLLEACQEVWDNVRSDLSILDKWKAASQQLGWLEYVKSFHGSVEKSSLEKAEMINSKGTYVIKCSNDDIPSVENSIQLIMLEANMRVGAVAEIKMTLNDLRDLQSRLMLIAGESAKGEVDVTRFMKVLSSVENLTKTYVKLKTSGCPLFSDWSANVRCENEGHGNVTVEVFFDEKCQAISSNGDIINELVNLTAILDEAYCQWMTYLLKNRDKHYHLNHFNIQQLTYLCKELARPGAYEEQVHQLLAAVLPDADQDIIYECLEEATRVDETERWRNIVVAEDEENLSVIDKKKNMVKKLVRLELSEKLAKAAVQSVGFEDTDDCLIWALSNAEDIEELSQQFDREMGYESNQHNSKVIYNVVDDRSDLTLKDVIGQLQSDTYSDKATMSTIVKTICKRYFTGTSVTSLEDYLSLEHCGKFLTNLANHRNQARLPRRVWAEHFTEGKPNLLICRQPKDVLLVLLSLYMQSPDQGLPSSSEVLLCSEDTSGEDVELLFRRAVGLQTDTGRRIYCLARADLLSFNVSKQAEECFENLMQLSDRNTNFRLVILTCSEQHYLTSCFYEHRVEGFGGFSQQTITKYIKKHLSRRKVADSAAAVDENCSSAIVVRSDQSGMGKSLYISRCRDKVLQDGVSCTSTIRLLKKSVNIDDVVMTLRRMKNNNAHFVHVDVTPSVQFGKSKLLFELVILGKIQNSRGAIWRHLPNHLYMLEYTESDEKIDLSFSKFLNLLPSVRCLSPVEVRDTLQQNPNQVKPEDQIFMDAILLESEMYQRPYQYLRMYSANENLDNFMYSTPVRNSLECVNILLQFCSIRAPSWSELSHFSKFLNTQLQDCEESDFVNTEILGDEFRGFKQFVVRFMIRMSQDFATPSLVTNNDDDDNDNDSNGEDVDLLELHSLRRKWESSFHPYVFFNADRHSMSFANFNVNNQGSLCNPRSRQEIERNLMHPNLVRALTRNFVDLQQDIDKMPREKKLAVLCQVFGVKEVIDPDQTYELTTDNVLKMLAIQMRFRCGIPVVIMGETGCGKTRMIEFMSRLKAGGNPDVQNMVVVKVHGGVTASMVQEKVEKAIVLARRNQAKKIPETILFLDEANTTEAIYAIKEIMCDETVRGVSFADSGLRIVAACNPYRAHPPDVIEAMEKSGLGFHVRPEDVSDTFDDIPMRHLVYRVIALPPSMRPLVWDFGQLNNETEEVYINQMVIKLFTTINRQNTDFPIDENAINTITKIVTASQAFMRNQSDVCRYVSLRDAERSMQCFQWFYEHLQLLRPLINEQKEKDECKKADINHCVRALIQAVSVCYHATLDEREGYRLMLAEEINRCERIDITEQMILDEIIACQNVFINAIELEKNIACNKALRENVFMMVICAEMRIPLFLVGKPGSSKSLAKTIVTDAMQGKRSKTKLYRHLKEIHVLSFQCSAATDAVGIEAVFAQCAQLQKEKDCSKYVATVVLDEIGLAEDSKKMPLKVLHPLLEAASTTNFSNIESHQKVGFVGISNWALDPAKMNRGIFVTRGKPSNDDLHKTAEAIFESDQAKLLNATKCIRAVTEAYLEIYKDQAREFFGLRDYYAMMKMLFASPITEAVRFNDVGMAIIRNFSGAPEEVLSCFQKHCKKVFKDVQFPHIPVTRLICSNLDTDAECRFLMILTKQYSAVNLLPEILGNRDYVVIFGSSFPHDHDYTEVCRNINKIKVCMETGRTVVLLNLRDLYESLYDALNQHYVKFANQRYVDLGLGGHRVKCRIASKFKLIVIEEKEVVYDEYPIPLINRLEKHVFEMGSVLLSNEKTTIHQLKEWVNSCYKGGYSSSREFDTFVGYNEDTCASALLSSEDRSFEATQRILLQTATLDGVCRFPQSEIIENAENLLDIYMNEQIHDSLCIFLEDKLQQEKVSINEIVSFSQVLNERDKQILQNRLQLMHRHFMVLMLQQFQTEQQFSERVDKFLEYVSNEENGLSDNDQRYLLLIQCSQAHKNASLTACAKYSTMNKMQKFKADNSDFQGSFTVCFLFTLERSASTANASWRYINFYCKDCSTAYIDELKPNLKPIAPVSKLWSHSLHEVLALSCHSQQSLIDVKQLMRESIPIAMAKLQNRVQDSKRNRIQLLLSICFENDRLRPMLDIILNKMLVLIEDRERKLSGRDEWIIDQACSARALQEGGTFTNVLWLRIKTIVAVALAKIVSVADADNNIDLLVESVQNSPNIADLWFQMFERDNLWDLQWISASMNGAECSFTVEGTCGFSCFFPFTRTLHRFLLKEHQMLQDTNVPDQRGVFLQKMESSPINWILDAARDIGMNAIERFVGDLVHLMYNSRSEATEANEFDVVFKYLLHLHGIQRQSGKLDQGNVLVELFLLLLHNMKKLHKFSELVEIFPDVIPQCSSWIDDDDQNDEFWMHRFAFDCVIVHLDTIAKESFGKVESCNLWKSLVVKTKQISEKMIQNAPEKVQKMWQRIVFVEMFLDELLPAAASPKTVSQYLKPLSLQARLLWSGAVAIKDLSKLRFLKIVVNSLRKCTKEMKLRLLCNWKDIGCRACKREALIDPIILNCGHYFCQKCITGTNCPYCRSDIDKPNSLSPMKLSGVQQKEFTTFNRACTSFFLEYLSTICFPVGYANLRNDLDEIFLALEELVVNDDKTKIISPVLAELDLDPTARSYILQLILRCDEKLVEQQLESHFNTMERVLKDRTALMGIYIKCKQDILFSQSVANDESTMECNRILFAHRELRLAVEHCQNANMLSQLEHLRICAVLQFVAKIAASCIMQTTQQGFSKDQSHQTTRFIRAIYRLCAGPEFLIFRQFIVKCLCRRYGADALNVMLDDDLFRRLVPENLLPQADEEKDSYFQADKLSLTGERYQNTKILLLDIAQESDERRVVEQIVEGGNRTGDDTMQILLAVSVWVAYDRGNPARLRTFQTLRQQIPQNTSVQIYVDIIQGQFEQLRCRNASSSSQYSLTELLVHFGVTVCNSQDNSLQFFRQMAANPTTFVNLYLPTMPATDFAAIRNAFDGVFAAHVCPNGHPYYIGQCGRPMELARCNECGAQIGGRNHALVQGNRAGEAAQQKQTGYIMRKTASVIPERNLSKLSVCAMRICLHLAMLLGSRNGNVVAGMVQRAKGQEVDFLFEEILFDLIELSKLIGCCVDDIYMLMHFVFNGMRTAQNPPQQRYSWNSLNERQAWEDEFQRLFLTPIFSNTANIINQAQNIMLNAGKLNEKPLQRLIFELKKDDLLPDGIVAWNVSNLWKYMLHVDINHLRQTLETVNTKACADGAALKVIINSENLETIQHLCTVVAVQAAFIKKYRQRIDMSNAEEITIQDFLEEENYLFAEDIDKYIDLWNKVRMFSINADRYNMSPSYLDDDISRDSPISMCLPSLRGRGLCALLMANFLIEKQNNLLVMCRERVEPKPSLKAVDVGDLDMNDVVCINTLEDLMPIVLENSQYETTVTESGLKHNITYNLGLLQKKILQKFIVGKRIINKETLPLMEYPQDVGLAKDFRLVQNESTQDPLPLKICQEVDDLVENCITSKLCEVVRTLTLVVQFLAKDTSISEDKRIFEFAERELLLPPEESEMIPRSAQISHCLALYERLSWHRSKRLIQNGQNPFENVVESAEDIEDQALLKRLKEALKKLNVNRLQLELNALLMVGPPMDNSEWRLGKDVLLPYLEMKYDEDDHNWCEQIPDEILFKHAVHVFLVSINHAAK